jgi:hypothetical protein
MKLKKSLFNSFSIDYFKFGKDVNRCISFGRANVLITDLNGGWQNILLTNLKDYGGVRTFSFQKEKLIEISSKISNPFWKDIFSSLHLAKPYTLINMNECLSLDI